jgi:soluble cytochrome b562
MDTQMPGIRNVRAVLEELERLVDQARQSRSGVEPTIKDFRRIFDQESAKMNQAIFNDQQDQIRETCVKAVLPLLEILSRT